MKICYQNVRVETRVGGESRREYVDGQCGYTSKRVCRVYIQRSRYHENGWYDWMWENTPIHQSSFTIDVQSSSTSTNLHFDINGDITGSAYAGSGIELWEQIYITNIFPSGNDFEIYETINND